MDSIFDSPPFGPDATCDQTPPATGHPVRYGNGEIQLAVTDLSSRGFGATWGHTRIYNNRLSQNYNFGNGWNWMVSQWSYMLHKPNGTLAVVRGPQSTIWFDPQGGGYAPRYGALYSLVHDTVNHVFRMMVPNGEVWEFHDFDQLTFPQGALKSYVTAGGKTLDVISYSAAGNITEVQRHGPGHSEAYVYVYNGDNLLTSVTLRRKRGSEAWSDVRRVVYDYYGMGATHGLPGDLHRAEYQELSGVTWETVSTNFYRYYLGRTGGIGFAHGLKFALGPEAYARLYTATSGSPDTANDSTVAQYADHYFEYGPKRRVTKETVAAGTQPTKMWYRTSTLPKGYNNWQRRTVEVRPDDSRVVVFTNYLGQVLLKSMKAHDQEWTTYQQFDDNGRLVLQATPAAVKSYSHTRSSLTVNLREQAGLIHKSEYYEVTKVALGRVKGYLKAEKIQQGSRGVPITLRRFEYTSHSAGGITVYPVRKQTDYRNEDGSGAIATHWSYTFHPGTVEMKQRVTRWPAVPSNQNGSGTSAVRRELFDPHGQLIATQDERGYINTFQYNLGHGGMTSQVQDDDPPTDSGWSANSGDRLKLTSDYLYDQTGRQTQALGPAHDIDGTTVRTAQWTVYKDLDLQTYQGQGYATGSGPYTYTLVNPVTVTIMDQAGRAVHSIQATRTSTMGRLSASDSFTDQTKWCRWTHSFYDDSGLLTSSRVYFDIPSSGDGTEGTNYDLTSYDYDPMDRQNKVVSPAGTITRTVYNARGLVSETFIGTDDTGATPSDPTGGGAMGNDMKLVQENQYDRGVGGGNSNLTRTRQPIDDDGRRDRLTHYHHDFRDRQIAIEGEIDFYQRNIYDNLDRVIQVDRRNTTAEGALVARSQTLYDDRGRVYQTKRYAVNPSNGAVGNALVDNTWYDAAGSVIKSQPAGSHLFTKTIYDGVGRATAQYQGYYSGMGSESYADAGQVTSNNIIFEQTLTTYDEASNAIFAASFQRFHDATAHGALNDPTGSDPKARTSYMGMWYDTIGRLTATANYGTNANSGPPSRPTSAPSSSSTVLVSLTHYSACGQVDQTTDPAGMVTTTSYDDLGRTTETVQDNDGLAITTQMTYDPSGQLKTLVAINSDTGDQTTTYSYGVTLSDSTIASKDLLATVQYPDAVDGSDEVSYTYNRQQQRTTLTDQNGTVHEYDYDQLGRLGQDRVTTLGTLGGASIDGAVRRISRTYEVRGLLQNITSYDNASFGLGTVVNDVQLTYNTFQQLSVDYQAHGGPVNTSTSPKVQYGYADGSANTVRRGGIVYPSGRTVGYLYDATNSQNDLISRVSKINWNGVDQVAYTYIGLGSFVRADDLVPQVRWDLITGSGANPYAGLDLFGRTIDCRWHKYSSPTGDPVHLEYGYDQASNRLWRQDDAARALSATFDELYGYDTADRLTSIERGTLNGGHTGISSQTLEQTWDLDPTGNWNEFTQDNSDDLDQSREHNAANEITDISESVAPSPWPTPSYDRAGNTTGFPQPKALTSSYSAKYDAWNRLVELKSGATTVATMAYDGLNRRTAFTATGITRHFYYSDQWQVLEERFDSETIAQRLFAWGLRYVDDVILRDHLGGSSGASSSSGGVPGQLLYALQDANWNTVAVINPAASVEQRFAYTPYGEPAFLSDSFVDVGNELDWEMLFTGQRYDSLTGLYLYRNRYYHAQLGRFATRDPIGYEGAEWNLYRYVRSSPLINLDTSGLQDIGLFIDGFGQTVTSPTIMNSLVDDYGTTKQDTAAYYELPAGFLYAHVGQTWISDFNNTVNAGIKKICDSYCPWAAQFATCPAKGGQFNIDLFGWSRGAVAAMQIAEKLDSDGCTCKLPYGQSGFAPLPPIDTVVKHIPVRFLGILDPNSGGLLLGTGPTPTISPNVANVFWAVAGVNSLPWDYYQILPTSGQKGVKVYPTTHDLIGFTSTLTVQADLKNAAQAAGVTFNKVAVGGIAP